MRGIEKREKRSECEAVYGHGIKVEIKQTAGRPESPDRARIILALFFTAPNLNHDLYFSTP